MANVTIMKRFTRNLATALLTLVLCIPAAEARHHGRDERHDRHEQHDRPRHNHDNDRHRPDRKARPATGHSRHDSYNRHHGHPHRPALPARPYRPVWHHPSRPVPPPAWHPHPHAPRLHSVLGLAFGSTFNISLTYLTNNGYSIAGYGNDIVYLNNVNECNWQWPEATLYYTSRGLTRSEFVNCTRFPDAARYNALYRSLTATYGAPVATNGNGGLSATWFSPDRGYITLYYGSQYSTDSRLLYLTALTFGL